MPLSYYNLEQNCELAIWEISEPKSFFEQGLLAVAYPLDPVYQIKNEEKALQWLASRYLLVQVYPEAIQHYTGKKPVLFNGPHISFSHSGKNAAVLLSQKISGLDIQIRTDKLARIAPKFTTDKEVRRMGKMDKISALALLWSMKEAVFKRYETGLPFLDIQLIEFNPDLNLAHARNNYKGKTNTHRLKLQMMGDLALGYLLD